MDISPYVGQLHKTELEVSTIPYESIKKLSEFLEREDEQVYHILGRAFQWADSSSPWRQYETAEGAWVKRFSNFAYKQYSHKIAPELLSRIGDCISEGKTKYSTYFYEIAKYTGWRAGAFEAGKETCWWGSYNEWRIGLAEHPKGYSVLFYDSEAAYNKFSQVKGLARCWLLNEDIGPVIFNAYNINLTIVARTLAKLLGRTYERIHLSSGAYINQGSMNNLRDAGAGDDGIGFGFLLQEPDAPRFSKTYLELSDFSHKDGKCAYCGKRLLKKKSPHPDSDTYFCSEECMYQIYSRCEQCGGLMKKTEPLHPVHLGFSRVVQVCNHCYSAHNVCDVCGDTLYETVNVWHTSRKYCKRCIQEGRNGVHTCSSCGHVTDKSTTIPLARQALYLCPTCIRGVKEALHGD